MVLGICSDGMIRFWHVDIDATIRKESSNSQADSHDIETINQISNKSNVSSKGSIARLRQSPLCQVNVRIDRGLENEIFRYRDKRSLILSADDKYLIGLIAMIYHTIRFS